VPQGETVKTTIKIGRELWTEFSVAVLRDKGGRKKNEVIEELIRAYLKEREECGSEARGKQERG